MEVYTGRKCIESNLNKQGHTAFGWRLLGRQHVGDPENEHRGYSSVVRRRIHLCAWRDAV